ncbi:43532_t:CDS:1, partial [Gigaspora margarita]
EAQEHESTQTVITQQLQQACEQKEHESEPSLETIAQHNRSEYKKITLTLQKILQVYQAKDLLLNE